MIQIEALSPLTFGPGTVLALTLKQAEARRHILRDVSEGVYETMGQTQFKRGETLGLEGEVPKALRSAVLVDGRPMVKPPAAEAGGPVAFVMPEAKDIPARAKGRK